MKSGMSFINRGIFYNNLRSLYWLGIGYLLVLVFLVPLNILMVFSNEDVLYYQQMERLFKVGDDSQNILILIFPVLLAILLFRYLHNKSATVTIHSLPVTRGALFRTHVFSGLVLMMGPLFLTALMAWGLNIGLGLEDYYSGKDILGWLGITLVMNVLIFMVAVVVGMAAGLAIAQGVLTYILLFLPIGLSVLFIFNLEFFVYGFVDNSAIREVLAKLSPLVRILEMSLRTVTTGEVLGYLTASGVLFWLAGWLYSKRKAEAATQPIAFRVFRPVFKYGVTFCCMLVGGFYFSQVLNQKTWVYFGLLAGSFLGYIVAEIILRKSFRVWRGLKGYVYYAGVMVLLLLGLHYDLTGYERRVPDLAEVQQVYFGSGYFGMEKSMLEAETYYEKENIENIQKLHLQLVENKGNLMFNPRTPYQGDVRHMQVVYKLKNGKEIIRGYRIPMDQYGGYLKPVYESMEFKKNRFEPLRISPDRVDKITIAPMWLPKKAVITDSQHIKEAVEVLQKDITMATYEEITQQQEPWGTINLMLDNDKTVSISWDKGYEELENWLKQRGYYQNARVLPEDIGYVVVEKFESHRSPTVYGKPVEEQKPVKRLEIRDQKKIEDLLRAKRPKTEPQYTVGWYTQEKQQLAVTYLDTGTAPVYIREFFAGEK